MSSDKRRHLLRVVGHELKCPDDAVLQRAFRAVLKEAKRVWHVCEGRGVAPCG